MKHWISPPDELAEADMDGELSAARAAIRIRLKDHDCEQESDADEAETRYRRSLERAFGGPLEVSAALRAYLMACESDGEEIDAAARAQAEAWIKASQRASADGLGSLDGADEAWFEVTAAKVSAAVRRHAPRPLPVVPAAPAASLYVAPVVVEQPVAFGDLFPVRPVLAPSLAACEKAPTRTRARTKVTEPVESPQLDLF